MIHIFICDDDLIHQKRISNIIENYNLFHNNRLILQGIFLLRKHSCSTYH